MKKIMRKIMFLFIIILYVVSINLEVNAVTKIRKETGISETGSTYHIDYVDYINNGKISEIEIVTDNDWNANEVNSSYFDGDKYEVEYIKIRGDIHVNDEVEIWFRVKRDVGSENGLKFKPYLKYDSNKIYRDSSLDIVSDSETEWVNSFEIHLKVKALMTGNLLLDVLADDGYESVIRIILEDVKGDGSQNQGGNIDEEPGEGDFPGIDNSGDIDYWKPSGTGKNNIKLTSLAGRVLGAIQLVGSILSVVILVILGLKYMLASVEEKASYKQSMALYIVGCIMVFSISNIAKIIYDFATKLGS